MLPIAKADAFRIIHKFLLLSMSNYFHEIQIRLLNRTVYNINYLYSIQFIYSGMFIINK